MRRVLLALGAAAGVLLLSAAPAGSSAAAAPSYAVTALGEGLVPRDINGQGTVVGAMQTPGGTRAFVVARGGSAVDLGVLPGGTTSDAWAINEQGQIAGTSDTTIADWPGCDPRCDAALTDRAFRRDGRQLLDLGGWMTWHGSGSAPPSAGLAIDGSGNVGGNVLGGSGDPSAAYWVEDVLQRAGIEGFVTTINDRRDIAGIVAHQGGAFARIGGAQVMFPDAAGSENLHVDDGWPSINDASHVAYTGTTTGSAARHALLYADGVSTDLGTLGGASSAAFDVGSHDEVVGEAATGSGAKHAFLYENGTMIDLNDRIPASSGWILESARAINAAGQIVGIGNKGGFLLTPAQSGASSGGGGSGGGTAPPLPAPYLPPAPPPAPTPPVRPEAPLKLSCAGFVVSTRVVRPGGRLAAKMIVTRSDTGGRVVGARFAAIATLRGKPLPLTWKGWTKRTAAAVWSVPPRAGAGRVEGRLVVTVGGSTLTRTFTATVKPKPLPT